MTAEAAVVAGGKVEEAMVAKMVAGGRAEVATAEVKAV